MSTKIKVYIAAPWVCKAEANEAQFEFEEEGFEVTSHWIRFHPGGESDAELREQAQEDINDLLDADVFVIMNLDKSEGKAFEFGVAYATNMPIIVIGSEDAKARNIFYHLPEVLHVESVAKAIEAAGQVQWLN